MDEFISLTFTKLSSRMIFFWDMQLYRKSLSHIEAYSEFNELSNLLAMSKFNLLTSTTSHSLPPRLISMKAPQNLLQSLNKSSATQHNSTLTQSRTHLSTHSNSWHSHPTYPFTVPPALLTQIRPPNSTSLSSTS